MREKVRNFMEEYHMVEKGDCVLAAVSGGADSMCLLLLLLELRRELSFTVCAVHVEHGIRGRESQEDAAFVQSVCQDMGVPCKLFHGNALEYARGQKLSVEEGARKMRYGYFKQAAEEFGADKVAVAHNQNDCAETMIFHLARGAGLRGLCGIRPVREQVIRPLLCVGRQEIEAYLEEKQQGYRNDCTNQELVYTRNKIRHRILPELSQINPCAVTHMCQAAQAAAEAEDLLEDLASQWVRAYVSRQREGICISEKLMEEGPAVQRAVLYRALAEGAGSSRNISRLHVEQIRELFGRQCGKKAALPSGMAARRVYQGVLLWKRENQGVVLGNDQGWTVPVEGNLYIPQFKCEISTCLLGKMPQFDKIPKKMYTKWLDYDKIKGNMRLRTRREQDFLVIDAQGRRKKLKKYYIDEKVPAYQRNQIPLLADDDHILWVVGHRISEDVKVTQHTKRILEIRINGGTAHEG